ncbi:uncharacterized protein CEXT_511321 [Caerostris extrusa]|uniref:Uncharacterized protein n=1 Tax=Caerostris extrusa TaxID=172846 RepID=A0AAV4WAI3_CAEEX|nr:uncharacterized protein CEXT_511321 [Caerostris extrusa]
MQMEIKLAMVRLKIPLVKLILLAECSNPPLVNQKVASGVSLIEESVSNLSVSRDYAGVLFTKLKTALERLTSEFSLALNKSKTSAFGEISAIDDREAESKFSFKNCLPSNDSDDDSLASKPDCQENKNSSSDGQKLKKSKVYDFFQFRSKHAMEEFNKKPPALENSNVEMIVPTKTFDITQIKGWRNKYFASESEIHHSYAKSENNIDDSSQNAVSLPH